MKVLRGTGYIALLYFGMFLVAMGVGGSTAAPTLAVFALAAAVGTIVGIVSVFLGLSLTVLFNFPVIPMQVACIILSVGSTAFVVLSA